MLLVALLGLGVHQGALEVVERRQQLRRDAAHAVARCLLDALSALLAQVLDLRRLAQRDVLPVGLRRLLGSLRGRGWGRARGLTRRGLLRGGLLLLDDVGLVGHLLALVHDLGVDDVLLGGGAVGRRAVGRGSALGRGLLLRALVHGLGDPVERGLQRLGLDVDVGCVLGGQRLADLLDRGLDLVLGGGVHLLTELLELALGLVGGVLAVVAGLGELASALVLVGVRLGVGDHALDLV